MASPLSDDDDVFMVDVEEGEGEDDDYFFSEHGPDQDESLEVIEYHAFENRSTDCKKFAHSFLCRLLFYYKYHIAPILQTIASCFDEWNITTIGEVDAHAERLLQQWPDNSLSQLVRPADRQSELRLLTELQLEHNRLAPSDDAFRGTRAQERAVQYFFVLFIDKNPSRLGLLQRLEDDIVFERFVRLRGLRGNSCHEVVFTQDTAFHIMSRVLENLVIALADYI